MKFVKLVGLSVVKVEFKYFDYYFVLFVERFDRKLFSFESVKCRYMIDVC